MQKSDIVSTLKTSICDVKFTKVNGEERLMRCTLKTDMLPEYIDMNDDKKVNESVVPVWDLDKKGWRSFRVDSVINIQTVIL